MEKVGRNDPCPCGSGKKYKQCCINKVFGPKTIKAKWLNPKQTQVPQGVDLMDRAFGDIIKQTNTEELPPLPSSPPPPKEKNENL